MPDGFAIKAFRPVLLVVASFFCVRRRADHSIPIEKEAKDCGRAVSDAVKRPYLPMLCHVVMYARNRKQFRRFPGDEKNNDQPQRWSKRQTAHAPLNQGREENSADDMKEFIDLCRLYGDLHAYRRRESQIQRRAREKNAEYDAQGLFPMILIHRRDTHLICPPSELSVERIRTEVYYEIKIKSIPSHRDFITPATGRHENLFDGGEIGVCV